MSDEKIVGGDERPRWRAVNHVYCGPRNQAIDDWCVEDVTGERIVEVHASDSPDEHVQARAHLIAAAPDLYQALKNLVGLAEQRGRLDEYTAALDVARAALAKAEGTEP